MVPLDIRRVIADMCFLGAVPFLCPVRKKRSEIGRSQVKRDGPFQLVETYKCLCASCPYELRILRISGGLVLLEKQKATSITPILF